MRKGLAATAIIVGIPRQVQLAAVDQLPANLLWVRVRRVDLAQFPFGGIGKLLEEGCSIQTIDVGAVDDRWNADFRTALIPTVAHHEQRVVGRVVIKGSTAVAKGGLVSRSLRNAEGALVDKVTQLHKGEASRRLRVRLVTRCSHASVEAAAAHERDQGKSEAHGF